MTQFTRAGRLASKTLLPGPRVGDHYHHNHTYPLKGQRGKKFKNEKGNKNKSNNKSPLEHSDSYSYKRYTQL